MAEVNCVFVCQDCSCTCGSRQQLATRAFNVHGVRRRTRDLIYVVHCPVSMQCFHTRVRVIIHLDERS
eukprot:1188061-Pyramimonas_sp.AAC.1